jgi:hypothetical protein
MELLRNSAVKAWAFTIFDIALVVAAYEGACWVFGVEATTEGWALTIAITALHGVSRLRTGRD